MAPLFIGLTLSAMGLAIAACLAIGIYEARD
jgi:hypothetical protein